MDSAEVICRLCAALKDEGDFSCDLSTVQARKAEEPGENTFSDCVNFYCRVNLNCDPTLSQKICRVCRLTIETFIAFRDNVARVEKAFNSTNGRGVKEEEVDIKMEPEKSSQSSSSVGVSKDRFAMNQIGALYADEMKKSFFDLQLYSHITVEREFVAEDGEISNEWLTRFAVSTWKDFTLTCYFCKANCKSVKAILQHLKEIHGGKVKLSCHVCKDAQRVFSSLNAYINHFVKVHDLEHLSYTCIDCSKTYYNIACLIKHVGKDHPRTPSIYPCIECGSFCQSITTLKTHLMSHVTQGVDESTDDDDAEPGNAGTSTAKGKARENAVKSVKKRKVFPCNKCDRELLTKRGHDYHQLIHSDSKPYECKSCDAKYRSKQDLDKHVAKHHSALNKSAGQN